MSVPVAFIGVIVIWSTTPLAIQWSSEGWGFLFGATGRMVLGAMVCVALLLALRHKLPLDRKAWETYIAAGMGIYGAMMSVYWGSQYISSGLVAVIFGLTPVVTAVLAAVYLQEASLTLGKIAGVVLGIIGLIVIFAADINGQAVAWEGVVALLFSVILHSSSGVWVKRINRSLSALATTTGGLLIAAPLYVITWFIIDGEVPTQFAFRPSSSLVYLGVVGTVIGFSLYFYILKNLEANRVALIPLVTPVLALLIGQNLNSEIVSIDIWVGTALIIAALGMHQWGDQLMMGIRTYFIPARR